jgi:hypothetical protein
MVLKGIKRGKAIELREELDLLDGKEVNIEVVSPPSMSRERKMTELNRLLALPDEEVEDLTQTLEMLERERNEDWEAQFGDSI